MMIPSTMHALTFAGPAADVSQAGVTTAQTPTPGDGEILIRVTHAGINFKDIMVRRGDPGYVPSWPVVPGLEVAGVVERLGRGAGGFEVGMRVVALTNMGGLAEYAVAGAELTTRVPDGVPSELAAVIPGVWATAWLLLHEAGRIRDGETILVHSASGAVGRAVATLAAAIPGTTLVGVVGATSRVEDAVLAGYQHVVVRGDDLVDSVLARLDGSRVDLVLDPQGTAWLDADLRLLAPSGRVVFFGNATGAPFDAVSIQRLLPANVSVGGFSIGALSASAPARVRRAMDAVLEGIAQGSLSPEVSVATGLDRAAALQQELADGTARTKHVVSLVP